MTVNRVVSLRFTASIVDTINNKNSFTITFPVNSNFTLANYLTSPGTHTLVQTSANVVTVTLASTFKIQAPGTVFSFTMGNYTAPESTQVTQPFTIAVSLNGVVSQTGTATIQAVANTLSFTAAPLNLEVNRNTSYVFTITTLDSISSSGRILVTFPPTITTSFPSSNCATISGTNVSSASISCSQPNSNSVMLSNLNSSSGRIPAQTLTLTLLNVVNPPSTQPTTSFSVTTYFSTTDDTLVATGTNGSVTSTVGILNSATVVVKPTSYTVLATGVGYTVTFVNRNQIEIGGIVRLGVPTGITAATSSITGSTCAVAIGSASSTTTTCTASSNTSLTLFNFTISSAISAGSTVSLTINSIFTNPSSTRPVSTFTIDTFSSNGFAIDTLQGTVSVAMTTPTTFSSINLTRASTVNGATGDYTFKIAQASPLEVSSVVKI
jgi:hypothetical protein